MKKLKKMQSDIAKVEFDPMIWETFIREYDKSLDRCLIALNDLFKVSNKAAENINKEKDMDVSSKLKELT